MKSEIVKITYPERYLFVEDCGSGQTWIVPLGGNESSNLRNQVSKWAKTEFCGELKLDGNLMPQIRGDYYAQIITGGDPYSGICWHCGGFYLTPNPQ